MTGILTKLVGKLLTHNGDRSAEPRHYRHGEGGADSKAIDEVVESVTQGYHPRHRLDAGHGCATQPVARHPPGHLNVPEGKKERNITSHSLKSDRNRTTVDYKKYEYSNCYTDPQNNALTTRIKVQ